MNARAILVVFLFSAAALVTMTVFFRLSSPDSREHQEFTARLAARRALDQKVARHALEARFAFSANYDPLADDDREERNLERELLSTIPSFLRPAERWELESALGAYARLAARRQQLLERFKSRNALLRNSVSFFPTLAADEIRRSNDARLSALLNDLRAQTLNLALTNEPRVLRRQALSLAEVAGEVGKLEPGPTRRHLELLLNHARVIASEKQAADTLLGNLLELPIAAARERVTGSYEREYARASRQAGFFGNFVSLLALALLALVAYAGVGLRRAAAELNRVNAGLEAAVSSRTAELKEAMARRERMEIELRQAQKLESVGQLAAGIAHEINSPIQYVGDSIHFLRGAFTEVSSVLDAYREGASSLEPRAAPAAFVGARRLEDEVDLEFLRSEIGVALERAVDGTREVGRIVSAMKNFAHTSVEKTALELNAVIANTIIVARNEYKYTADLESELGELPLVTCNSGAVGQVFLNLIVNAAHAISDVVEKEGGRGSIRIRSERLGPTVRVSVADSGGGIPESVRSRIFDPFFTTKAPGKGSGQGLAIARSIVDQHGGKLWFESELGRGTTFFVELPIEALEGRPSLEMIVNQSLAARRSLQVSTAPAVSM